MGVFRARERACRFAERILLVHKRIKVLGPEYVHIGLQLVRASSACAAMLEEGSAASSRKDLRYRHSVALREVKEAKMWIRMLIVANVAIPELRSLFDEADQIAAILFTSVATRRADDDADEQSA
jgi:four helix bundle protein